MLAFKIMLLTPLLTLATSAFAKTAIEINGTLQFWSRTCDENLECSLPKALSSVLHVTGQLTKPALGKISKYEHVVQHENLTARLQIFWVIKGHAPDQHYLSAQIRIVDSDTNTLIVECTHYDHDQHALYFPTGACSGDVDGQSIGLTQTKTRN